MATYLPKRETFHTPKGDHRAVVYEAFEMPDGTFRIKFQIPSLATNSKVFFAGKSYKPGSSWLYHDLREWLGEEGVDKLVNADNAIVPERLVGLHADIHIEHEDKGQKSPLVCLKKIAPPGTLVPDLENAA